ncbi:OsmC family protein [Paenibacillus sp. GSMTC-2017]|uniref:OsmC family protein n=1 Tax=Paenibacillus sp. GSMTC-2017 TaxID=2794350 RepID=UPI0018D9B564|nr:OsmC family protein [Paenibacillus sp. GSMTC-2017]MBH5318733.1 OsmC family protein [Paenibacillus sp. GSMTC-2017]
MSKLNEYLKDKKEAIDARNQRLALESTVVSQKLKAGVRVAGRSGVREIRIRDFQVISDSGPDFGGHQLGPASPELQLGVLGSCLSHITLIQAAVRGVPLDAVEVDVTGDMHPLAGKPGYEDIPVYVHNIAYTLRIESSATAKELAELHEAVEIACPILNLLQQPQHVSGTLLHIQTEEAAVQGKAKVSRRQSKPKTRQA